MNQNSPVIRALFWKEARQAIPLAFIGVVLVVFLFLVWLTLPLSVQRAVVITYLPIILPMLYAVGIGTVLVSQEKLTGSLDWFNTIPVAPGRVITIKLAVAFAGLMLMWGLCVVFHVPMSWMDITPTDVDVPVVVTTFFYSVLIVLCGVFTAWRLENSFTSLVLGVVLAFLPLFAVTILEEIRWLHPTADDHVWQQVGFSIAMIPVVAYLIYRAGGRRLAPRAAPRLSNDQAKLSFDAWHPPQDQASLAKPFRYRLSSLIWQSVHHNRYVLLGISAVVVIGLSILPLFDQPRSIRGANFKEMVAILIFAALGVSSLGVLSHYGDGAPSRMRFLSERGVSPTKAWLGLHLIGLGVIAAGCVGYFLAMTQASVHSGNGSSVPLPSISFLLLICLLIYGVSQATSQAMRIMAASLVIAPVFSLLAIGWLAQLGPIYGSPLWVLILTAMIPLALTWWCMGDHMDGRRGIRFWAKFAFAMFLFLALPLVPPYVAHWRFPSVTSVQLAAIQAEVTVPAKPHQWLQSITRTPNFEDHWRPNGDEGLTGKEAAEVIENQSNAPEYWMELSGSDDQPLRADTNLILIAIGTMNLHSMKLAETPDDESLLQDYAQWGELLDTMSRRLRLSNRLFDQSVADLIEIELLATLSEPELTKFLNEDFAVKAIRRMADTTGRNLARRRALIASWQRAQAFDANDRVSFYENYELNTWFDYLPSARRQWVLADKNAMLVHYLLTLLDAGGGGANASAVDPILREIHLYLLGPGRSFQTSPYSPDFRSGSRVNRVANHRAALQFPGTQWFAPWEDNAVQLAQSIQETP